MDNWAREFTIHSYIPKSKVQVVDGTTKADGTKLKTMSLALKLKQLANPNASIFITNTDSIGNKNIFPVLLDMGFEFMAIDESHKFKSYKANRTKNLHKISSQAQLRYKFILTGSPVLQSALDLWSQFYILDPKILGANYFSFRAKYFYDKNADMPPHIHFANWIPKDKAFYKKFGMDYVDPNELLNGIIYKHANRVMKNDVLDLPERLYQRIDVSFNKEQGRIYNEMKTDLLSFLEDPTSKKDMLELLESDEVIDLPESMQANLAIVKTLRMQMIVNGIFTNAEGEVIEIPCNKYNELEDFLETVLANPANKVIVWSVFSATYERIAKVVSKFTNEYTFLTGKQSYEEKIANVDYFNKGSARVIIANQGAGGTGINLTAANYDLYFSRGFNLEHDLQSEARAYRGGQTRNVTRVDLVINDSIDSDVLTALQAKKEVAEDILAPRKEFTAKEIIGFIK